MGDISQRRNWHNLGARSRRFVCEIAICFTPLACFLPHDLRVEWSSILSPDRKWPSPTPENERVGCVAWQGLLHFHGEGLSTNVLPSWGLLASLLPRGTVIKDTRLEKTSVVFVPGRFGCQVFQASSLALAREGGKDIYEFQHHMPPTFCFPGRLIDINAVPCRHLPPSDALVIVGVLSGGDGGAFAVVASRATRAPQGRSQRLRGDAGHCFRQGYSGARVLRSVVSSLFSRLQRR